MWHNPWAILPHHAGATGFQKCSLRCAARSTCSDWYPWQPLSVHLVRAVRACASVNGGQCVQPEASRHAHLGICKTRSKLFLSGLRSGLEQCCNAAAPGPVSSIHATPPRLPRTLPHPLRAEATLQTCPGTAPLVEFWSPRVWERAPMSLVASPRDVPLGFLEIWI